MQTGKWQMALRKFQTLSNAKMHLETAMAMASFRFVVVSKTFVAALRSNAELCSQGRGQQHSGGRTLLLLHYLNVH